MTLKEILEKVAAQRGAGFLANDPLQFPRRYRREADREVAAFLSAALAYGRVSIIRKNLEDLFSRIGPSPAEFVGNFEPARDGARLKGFKHRFNSGEDLACLCYLLRRMIEGAGSLENYFLLGDEPGAEDIGPGLSSFCRRALEIDVSPLYGTPLLPARSSVRYFFPSPLRGSACKRLCMLMRWLARPDDGIDLGLWKGISPARLVVPIDTHTARISRLLGMAERKSPDWKMALEVTRSLRRLDPQDPVRYDFALAHLGISEGCEGKKSGVCLTCPAAGLCIAVRQKSKGR